MLGICYNHILKGTSLLGFFFFFFDMDFFGVEIAGIILGKNYII